jgi:hypothetical protein
MRLLTSLILATFVLLGCNLKEGVKETGDAIGKGAENIVEGVKQTPKAIGDAGHKLDKDINK